MAPRYDRRAAHRIAALRNADDRHRDHTDDRLAVSGLIDMLISPLRMTPGEAFELCLLLQTDVRAITNNLVQVLADDERTGLRAPFDWERGTDV